MSVLVREVRPWGGPLTDLGIVDGVFVPPELVEPGSAVIEGEGRIALPTAINSHVHPDKTMWGESWLSRPPMRELTELIDFDVEARRGLGDTVATRAGRLMRDAVATGTRAMRAHVDVAPVYGLDNVVGTVEAATALSQALDVQVVAFPQLGVMRAPGTADVMRQAMAAGADLVGGLDPWSLDGDAEGQMSVMFSLAHEFDAGIDLHLHDHRDEGALMVQTLAERALAEGLYGRLTISHAFALGEISSDLLVLVIDALLAGGVSLTTCAHGDAPLLPLRELIAAGVPVGLGTDGIRDPWSPYGSPDMVERAWLTAYRLGVSSDEEVTDQYRLAVDAASHFLGLAPSRLHMGDPADFMLVTGECPAQIVVDRPPRDLVLRRGEVVAVDGKCLL